MKNQSRNCPKHLIGAMPFSEPDRSRWVRKFFNTYPVKSQRCFARDAARDRKKCKFSRATALSMFTGALTRTWPEIQAIDPRKKVFKSIDLIRHATGGKPELNEAIGFKGRSIVWTDGARVKPVSLKWAATWYAKMETVWAKSTRYEPDMGGNNHAIAGFLRMVAKAL